jgi:hypothetical protein
MITIMFMEGNKHVSPVLDLHRKLLEKLNSVTDSNVWKLNCSIHGSRSHAILLIDAGEGSAKWDVVDLCCENFRREIGAEMPYPWNHSPGIRRFESTT